MRYIILVTIFILINYCFINNFEIDIRRFCNLIKSTVLYSDSTNSFYPQNLSLKNDSITLELFWVEVNNDSIINQDNRILNAAYLFYESVDNYFERKAFICEKLGISLYQIKPDSSIFYFKKASDYYKKFDAKRSILCLQNIAFIYDEQLNDFEQASLVAQECVSLWEEINSQADIANMFKYVGYLNGRLGNFNAAKSQINTAINIYKSLSNIRGIAVSSLNLAKIYELNSQFDSCILNAYNSKGIWEKLRDYHRLFNANNYLTKVYLGLDSLDRVRNCIEENSRFTDDEKIYWKDKLDFYRNASKYFQLLGDPLRLKSFFNKEDKLLKVYQYSY